MITYPKLSLAFSRPSRIIHPHNSQRIRNIGYDMICIEAIAEKIADALRNNEIYFGIHSFELLCDSSLLENYSGVKLHKIAFETTKEVAVNIFSTAYNLWRSEEACKEKIWKKLLKKFGYFTFNSIPSDYIRALNSLHENPDFLFLHTGKNDIAEIDLLDLVIAIVTTENLYRNLKIDEHTAYERAKALIDFNNNRFHGYFKQLLSEEFLQEIHEKMPIVKEYFNIFPHFAELFSGVDLKKLDSIENRQLAYKTAALTFIEFHEKDCQGSVCEGNFRAVIEKARESVKNKTKQQQQG